jgi:hypothetical protein
MRLITLAALALLAGCGNIPGYPARQAQDDACFLATAKAAFAGDFHDVALPSWVPGKHLSGGQVSSCMAK